jgi:hypothetical protein
MNAPSGRAVAYPIEASLATFPSSLQSLTAEIGFVERNSLDLAHLVIGF